MTLPLLGAAAALALAAGDVLTIGDPAPPLDVAHWLRGEPVTDLKPGRVYVIEFWATWCGPCVANMPHLSGVQEQYAGQGVTVIGISDEPLATVVRFVCSRSRADGALQYDRARYALATDPDGSVFAEYMRAAGQAARPTTFIVGRDGRVEWIGHPEPGSMDAPVAAVVSGDWDRAGFKPGFEQQRAGEAEAARAIAEVGKAIDAGDWEAALAPLDELVALGRDTYAPTKLGVLLSRLADSGRGYAYARQLMAEHWNGDGWILYQVAWVISGNDRYPIEAERRDLGLALEAVTRANELGGWGDFDALALQAAIEFAAGRRAAAIEHQRLAVQAVAALEPKLDETDRAGWSELLAGFRETLARYEE